MIATVSVVSMFQIIPVPVTDRLIQQISGSDEPEVVEKLRAVRRRRV